VVRLPLSDPDLAEIREAMLDLAEREPNRSVDRETLRRHLKASGHDRAFARVAAWPQARLSSEMGADGDSTEEAREAEWMAQVTLDVVVPALKEEMATLASAANQGDGAAFERFLMLDRDARRIEDEMRARRA
jgi:hypothetical protein